MGFFDRLGNVARGAARVESRAWAEGGGLEGRLERLGEGLRAVVQGAPAGEGAGDPAGDAAGDAEGPLRPPGSGASVQGLPRSARTPAAPAEPPDEPPAELAALDADLAAGRITRGEWSRRRAELRRARHGRRL